MNVFVFVTGNLVAESLLVAAREIKASNIDCSVQLLTDGAILAGDTDLVGDLKNIDLTCDEVKMSKEDILITGMMWPGHSERRLITLARKSGATPVVVLPDIAGNADKFKVDNGFFLPDYICVSDKCTYDNLVAAGIPSEIIIPTGSMYLDDIFRCYTPRATSCSELSVGYLSVPNKRDFSAWGRDFGF